jgi:hypothetical protein
MADQLTAIRAVFYGEGVATKKIVVTGHTVSSGPGWADVVVGVAFCEHSRVDVSGAPSAPVWVTTLNVTALALVLGDCARAQSSVDERSIVDAVLRHPELHKSLTLDTWRDIMRAVREVAAGSAVFE